MFTITNSTLTLLRKRIAVQRSLDHHEKRCLTLLDPSADRAKLLRKLRRLKKRNQAHIDALIALRFVRTHVDLKKWLDNRPTQTLTILDRNVRSSA